MRRLRLILWSLVGVVALAVGGLSVVSVLRPSGQPPVLAASAPMVVPFSLIDQRGRPVTQAAMTGRPFALFFGFTHCPEVCPTTLYELTASLDGLGGQAADLPVFFVTVDPERDTPEALGAYVESFGPRVTAITGEPSAVGRLADAWHVYRRKVPLEGGGYTMDHTASVFLVDGEGRLRSTIAFGEPPENAKTKLSRLVAGE